MPEKHFSALGYGKFRPIIDIEAISTPAKKSEARATNRRVEIYLDAFLKQKMNGEI
jgi:flagellar motor protein MotB